MNDEARPSAPSRRAVLKASALGLAFGNAPVAPDDPVAALATRYLALYREASHRSREWRRLVDELERCGFGRHPVYHCEGTWLILENGDTSAIVAHFAAALEAVPDAPSRAAIERRREDHLGRAATQAARWNAAARELGLAEVSALNDRGWEALDEIDVESLWAAGPSGLEAAIALLRVVHAAGWDCGCHLEDCAGPRQALLHVIGFLETCGTEQS